MDPVASSAVFLPMSRAAGAARVHSEYGVLEVCVPAGRAWRDGKPSAPG
jgi:hypothetical protein